MLVTTTSKNEKMKLKKNFVLLKIFIFIPPPPSFGLLRLFFNFIPFQKERRKLFSITYLAKCILFYHLTTVGTNFEDLLLGREKIIDIRIFAQHYCSLREIKYFLVNFEKAFFPLFNCQLPVGQSHSYIIQLKILKVLTYVINN